MNLYISILKYFITCCVLHATVEGQELSGKLDNIMYEHIFDVYIDTSSDNCKYVNPAVNKPSRFNNLREIGCFSGSN